MKEQKGITLIALVITIIVMLILVAVTITRAINGGLFEKAGDAAGKTNNALTQEQGVANGTVSVNGVNGGAQSDINSIVDHYTSF
mgnify:FL=1